MTSSSVTTFATRCADGPPLGTRARASGDDQKRRFAPRQRKAYHKNQTTEQQSHSEENQETQQAPVSKQENCLPLKRRSQIKWNTDNNIPSGTVCIPQGATRRHCPGELWWCFPGILPGGCQFSRTGFPPTATGEKGRRWWAPVVEDRDNLQGAGVSNRKHPPGQCPRKAFKMVGFPGQNVLYKKALAVTKKPYAFNVCKPLVCH